MLAASTTAATAKIAMPSIDYLAIMPLLILLGGALIVLAATSLVRGGLRRDTATALTVLTAVAALVAALIGWHRVTTQGPTTTIAHAISFDGFAVFGAVTVTSALVLATLIGHAYLTREGVSSAEYHVLALVSAAGALLMAQANDLIVIFLALEILSIALYVLVAFNHKRSESGEAALKYFILGGFSSAIFVYGIALTYGATGTTNLTQLAGFLSQNLPVHAGLLYAGMGLVLVGFAFKVAAVPFHLWTPDVYQGAPSPVTGFMAAVAKAGGFLALLRVLVSAMGTQSATWQPIIYALAIASLLLGAFAGLVQRDLKRLLAFSSINHAGFILLGVEAATAQGVSASLYYLFAYAIMTVGTFGVLTLVGGDGDRHHDLGEYRGLARRQPFLGGALVILLLAQAGAPFTTGFFAKLGVVAASIEAGSWPLALIAMISAGVAVAVYLRVVVLALNPVGAAAEDEALPPSGASASTIRSNATLLLEADPELELDSPPRVGVPAIAGVSIALSVAVTVFFGIVPGPLLDFAHAATLGYLP
jgi:NADH-quinone oxidoreductase subunit N